MDKKRKRKFGFFNDFFDFDFEEEVGRMQKDMDELFSRMHNGLNEDEFERFVKPGKSKVYGFSLKMGPDGKPVFEEFGNIRPSTTPNSKTTRMVTEERKPLVDILKGKDEVTVIAEVPGAEEKDIKLSGDKSSLIIEVNGKRSYYKKLFLPAEVLHSKRKWTYRNGILEVKLQIK